MGVFDHNKELDIIKIQAKTIDRLTRKHCEAHPVRLILKQNINNSIYSIMALSLATNQKALGSLSLVDAVTNAAVTGSFTGTAATSDNQSVFTTSLDASGNVIVTGSGTGTANLTVATTAAYTDSNNNPATAPLTLVIPVTVTAVVTADTVNLVVTFGTPTAQ